MDLLISIKKKLIEKFRNGSLEEIIDGKWLHFFFVKWGYYFFKIFYRSNQRWFIARRFLFHTVIFLLLN